MADTEEFPRGVPVLQFDSADIRAKIEEKTSWISDETDRGHIVSQVLADVQRCIQQIETKPKKPAYWLARTMNGALREELHRRNISLPNTLTEDNYETITALVKKRIREDLQDQVVTQIFERLKREVTPIENLEHWTNKIIFHCLVDEINLQKGKSGAFQWQVLRETVGKKEDVDRELAAHHERAEAGEAVDVEFLPNPEQTAVAPEEQHVNYKTMAHLFSYIWKGNTYGSVLTSEKYGLTNKKTHLPLEKQEQTWEHFRKCAECDQKWQKLVDEQLGFEMDIANNDVKQLLEEDEEFRNLYYAADQSAKDLMARRRARRESGLSYEQVVAEDLADIARSFERIAHAPEEPGDETSSKIEK